MLPGRVQEHFLELGYFGHCLATGETEQKGLGMCLGVHSHSFWDNGCLPLQQLDSPTAPQGTMELKKSPLSPTRDGRARISMA